MEPGSLPYSNDQGRPHKHGAVLGPCLPDGQQWRGFALVSMPAQIPLRSCFPWPATCISGEQSRHNVLMESMLLPTAATRQGHFSHAQRCWAALLKLAARCSNDGAHLSFRGAPSSTSPAVCGDSSTPLGEALETPPAPLSRLMRAVWAEAAWLTGASLARAAGSGQGFTGSARQAVPQRHGCPGPGTPGRGSQPAPAGFERPACVTEL